MKTKEWLLQFAITFVIAFLVTVIMSSCWNYFIEKKGFIPNWTSSIVIGIVLGLIRPITDRYKKPTS